MHPLVRSHLSFVSQGRALSVEQARSLASLPPEHHMDILALARLSASAASAEPFACGIINAKSGRCAENCAFCAQSAHHATDSPAYPLVGKEALVARAEELAKAGARYMGIVISGTSPSAKDFDRLCRDAESIRRASGIRLCASLGLLRGDQALALKQAGFSSYHHNLETARSHYAAICTTHGPEEREATVRLAKAAGLRVCSGGIFGLGESLEQRLELAQTLAELDVDSIPVNFLNPIKGTPLQHYPTLPPDEALGIVALLRLMHPSRDIVICGGRSVTLGQWENLLFSAGANGLMIGDYLTTSGSPYEKDRAMLSVLGIRLKGNGPEKHDIARDQGAPSV